MCGKKKRLSKQAVERTWKQADAACDSLNLTSSAAPAAGYQILTAIRVRQSMSPGQTRKHDERNLHASLCSLRFPAAESHSEPNFDREKSSSRQPDAACCLALTLPSSFSTEAARAARVSSSSRITVNSHRL